MDQILNKENTGVYRKLLWHCSAEHKIPSNNVEHSSAIQSYEKWSPS